MGRPNHYITKIRTFNLKSISALYPVFSHLILMIPPISAVNEPMRIPGIEQKSQILLKPFLNID